MPELTEGGAAHSISPMPLNSRVHIFVIAGLAMIFLAAIASAVALGNEGSHVEIVLATEIDADAGAPLDSVEFVEAGITMLYATAAIEHGRTGERFRFEWTGGTDELVSEYELPGDIEGGWLFSALDTPGGMQPGHYRVELFRGGTRIGHREFEVAE